MTASQATRPFRSRTLPGASRPLRPLLRRPEWCSAPVACWGSGRVIRFVYTPCVVLCQLLTPALAQDAAAYAAGERAALTRAFQLALPGQQALGSLQAGLAALRSSVGADSAALRTAQANLAGTAATLQARAARLTSCVRRVRLWRACHVRSLQVSVCVPGSLPGCCAWQQSVQSQFVLPGSANQEAPGSVSCSQPCELAWLLRQSNTYVHQLTRRREFRRRWWGGWMRWRACACRPWTRAWMLRPLHPSRRCAAARRRLPCGSKPKVQEGGHGSAPSAHCCDVCHLLSALYKQAIGLFCSITSEESNSRDRLEQ